MLDGWRRRARAIRRDTYALYLASRDPRVPWLAKVVAAAVLAYALTPVDLIPDFIPVLGLLDDLVIVPLGLALVVRLVPPELMAEHRATAADTRAPRSGAGLAIVIATWVVVAIVATAVVVVRVSR